MRKQVHSFCSCSRGLPEPEGLVFACMAVTSGHGGTAHWDVRIAVSYILACQFWPHTYLVPHCKHVDFCFCVLNVS